MNKDVKLIYLKNVETMEELKAEYKRLLKIYHPDKQTGDLEVTKQINNEYDYLFPYFQNKQNDEAIKNKREEYKETPDMFKEILYKIINIEGIEIEICGYWIWISGNTKPHKKYLFEVGFHWARKKQMWYWRSENFKSKNRKCIEMNEIRQKYGSDKINKNNRNNQKKYIKA